MVIYYATAEQNVPQIQSETFIVKKQYELKAGTCAEIIAARKEKGENPDAAVWDRLAAAAWEIEEAKIAAFSPAPQPSENGHYLQFLPMSWKQGSFGE